MKTAKASCMAVAIGILLAVVPCAIADDWVPSHHCRRPHKPYEFTDDYERDSFKRDVEAYEECIDNFVHQQKEAAQRHQEAAKKAIDEWNSFVRLELR